MPVTERLQGIGRWSLTLSPNTPQSVLSNDLDPDSVMFGHVIVTPTRVPVEAFDAAGLLAIARYTGIVRARPTRHSLAGPGLAAWLGDEDGKGALIETAVDNTSETFANWIGDLLPSSLTSGTINTIAGSLTWLAHYMTPRQAIDFVCDQFGAEWRINPDGTFDAGTQSDLFVTTPTLVVRRGTGGHDINIDGLAAELDVSIDYDDFTTRTVLVADAGVGSADISPATSFKDLNGNTVVLTRLIEGTDTQSGNEDAAAQAQLNRFTEARRAITLDAVDYDIGRYAAPGDTVWVFDPDRGIYDLSNQVQYRGATIFPQALRLTGYTWPITRGMGVYIRPSNATGSPVIDLSDWVAWEATNATIDQSSRLEVGAGPRPITDSGPYDRPPMGAGDADGVTLTNDTSSATDTWEDWGTETVEIPNPGRNVKVHATLFGELLNATAGRRRGFVRVAISFDGGSTFDVGKSIAGDTNGTDVDALPIGAQHFRAGIPTGNIVAKAELREDSATSSPGDNNFMQGSLHVDVKPAP